MKKLKKNENSKSWNTYYELAGSCACGIQQYVIKILRSIKILEENGYDFYRFEKNVEE